ncbi:MAG TPA: zinc ribbon domain-containing protein [Candidatus Bathyarchaeia archaeon]|nr:zinc ribbon domain-containing protein [Candidatus Bathyarchaeia archaeon]
MPPRCPSCKGKMEYEPPRYVCTSCGLVISRYEFDKTKREHFGDVKKEEDDEFYEKKKKKEEYRDWYLSSDKEKYDDQ